jgi:ribonuclease HI
VKRAEEYLSTIRSIPELNNKYKTLIEALMKGRSIDSALRSSSLSRMDLQSALEALRLILSGRAVREETAPASSLGLVVYTDGASRGNPGKAACAAIIYDADGQELLRRAKLLGVTTNNVAEYEGVLLGLELARDLRATEVHLKLDSELVVRQLNGEYRVKSDALKPLYLQASLLLGAFPKATVSYVPRADNKESDKLANQALDGDKKKPGGGGRPKQ